MQTTTNLAEALARRGKERADSIRQALAPAKPATKKRTRPAGGRISKRAEIVAQVFWPTNHHFRVHRDDLRRASDELFGAGMYAPADSDDRAYLWWLSELALHLHYGDYWAYHTQAGAA